MSEAASIITFSQSGELLFEAINPAFETVLGRSDDEVRGMPFNQFFEPTLSLMSSSVESNVVLNSCGFV